MSGMNKRMKIFLTVSVLLNIVFLGFVGGAVYNHLFNRPWDLHREQLQPETRHLMARVFERNHEELKSKIRKTRKQKAKLLDLLTAEKFQRDVFEKELRQFHRMQGDIREKKLMSLLELAEQLPMYEREELVTLFDHALSDRRPRKGKVQHVGRPTPMPEKKPE